MFHLNFLLKSYFILRFNIDWKAYYQSGIKETKDQIKVIDINHDTCLISSIDAGKRLLMKITSMSSDDTFEKTFISSMCIYDQTITAQVYESRTDKTFIVTNCQDDLYTIEQRVFMITRINSIKNDSDFDYI